MMDLLLQNLASLFSPIPAHASLDSLLLNLNMLIINPLIVLLFAVALAYFLYGVLMFFIGEVSEEKKTDGKMHMLWGLVGLVIMFGVWAILNIVIKTLDIKGVDPQTGKVDLPKPK